MQTEKKANRRKQSTGESSQQEKAVNRRKQTTVEGRKQEKANKAESNQPPRLSTISKQISLRTHPINPPL